MIKAIIFDLGGVVLSHSFDFVTDLLAEPFRVTSNDVHNLYENIKEDWTTGKITIEQVANHFIKAFSSRKPLKRIITSWKKSHEKYIEFNQDVMRLIHFLRKNYKVYLLTNTMDLHFNAVNTKGLLSHFDGIYTSFEIGKRKPDKEIFDYFLKDTKLKPQECIFVDDKRENVQAAKNLKLHGILFKDFRHLVRALRELKIKIR